MNKREDIQLPNAATQIDEAKYKLEHQLLVNLLNELRVEFKRGQCSDYDYEDAFLDLLYNYELAASRRGVRT